MILPAYLLLGVLLILSGVSRESIFSRMLKYLTGCETKLTGAGILRMPHVHL
jgi:hypothetical protein